jgi:DNA-binding NarL/FixJ family response regulator
MNQPYSVFLVDDHTIVRNGLKGLIESLGNYKITGEYDNGERLINSIPFDKQPDLIIMDLNMPVMNGKETMQWLKNKKNALPVLILTLDTTDRTIIELFKLGARGYLPKSCTAETLKKAIDDIIQTGYYHNDLLSKALLENDNSAYPSDRESIISKLTDKERKFLELVCDENEYTYEEMGQILDVHRRTVDNYRIALFEKFNIKSKTGLVLFAIKYNLVDLEVKN